VGQLKESHIRCIKVSATGTVGVDVPHDATALLDLNPSESEPLPLTLHTKGLAPGSYASVVTIMAGNGTPTSTLAFTATVSDDGRVAIDYDFARGIQEASNADVSTSAGVTDESCVVPPPPPPSPPSVSSGPGGLNISYGGGGGGGSGSIPPLPGIPVPPPPAPSAHEVVQLTIPQTTTLERQAFDANLQLTNITRDELQGVDVTLNILDQNGSPRDPAGARYADEFAITRPRTTGYAPGPNLGTIAGGATATNDWTLVPGPGLGGDSGRQYMVSATYRYTINGGSVTFTTAPVAITVDPLPQLQISYTIPRSVSAFQPFKIGVIVRNVGAGTARKLRIESGQPVITDNQSGAALNFALTGAALDGSPVTLPSNALTLPFGDVGPGQTKAGYFTMVTDSDGTFTAFDATTQEEPFDGVQLSPLIQSVRTYIVTHDGVAVCSGGQVGLPPATVQVASIDMANPQGDPALSNSVVDLTSGSVQSLTPTTATISQRATPDAPVTIASVAPVSGTLLAIVRDALPPTGNPSGVVVEVSARDDAGARVLPAQSYWQEFGKVFILDTPTGAVTYTITYGVSTAVARSGLHPRISALAQSDGACGNKPQSQPELRADPTTLLADGRTPAKVTLFRADAGHRVRLVSSRGSVDTFRPAFGVTNNAGQFVANLTSSTGGDMVVTAQDLITGQTLDTSAEVSFVKPDAPPPVVSRGQIVIADVKGDCAAYVVSCPKDGFFMLGLSGLELPLQVFTDWNNLPHGVIDVSIDGHRIDSIPSPGDVLHYRLDINKYLTAGAHALTLMARSGKTESKPINLDLDGYRLPQWIVNGLSSLPSLKDGDIVLSVKIPADPVCEHDFTETGCKEVPWGFPGLTSHFKVQTQVTLNLPTSGGPIKAEVEVGSNTSANGGEANGGEAPKSELQLLGQPFEIGVSGKLEGVLKKDVPYVSIREAQIALSVNASYVHPPIGLVEALDVLPPEGPALAGALYAVPPLHQWIDDRAFLNFGVQAGLDGILGLGFDEGVHVSKVQVTPSVRVFAGAEVDLGFVKAAVGGQLDVSVRLGYDDKSIYFAKLEAVGSVRYGIQVGPFYSPEVKGQWQLISYPPEPTSGVSARRIYAARNWQSTLRPIGHVAARNDDLFQANRGTRQAFARPAARTRTRSGAARTTEAASTLTATQVTTTSLLATNVYTYTEPSLAVDPATGHALLLWVYDDPAQPVGQSLHLYYSHWDGVAWSKPSALTNTPRMDGAPQVAWTRDGKAVAVWQRLNATVPATATWTADTASKFEIATATYDEATGTWSPTSLLTNNMALDVTPRLVRNGAGDLMAVWHQNQSALISGDAGHPDRIMVAFYHNGTWTTPVAAVDGIPGLLDLAGGYGADAATIAYTYPVTPTGSVTPTLELFTSRWDGTAWSAPVQQTDTVLGNRSPQVAYDASNQPVVVWRSQQRLRLRNLDTGGEALLDLPTALNSVDEFQVVQDGADNIAAVFTAKAPEHNLFVSYYDRVHNLWGNPTRLTNDTSDERYPSAGMDSGGRLLAAYASTAITPVTSTAVISGETFTYAVPTPGQTDLLTLSHVFVKDLSLHDSDLALSTDHPAPGQGVVVSATVHNSGDLPLDDVAVGFYDGDPAVGGALIGTDILTTTLAGGFTATLTMPYTPPATGGAHTIYAVADPMNSLHKADKTDTTARIMAFGPDLRILDAAVDPWGGSTVGLETLIRNIGTSVASTSTLSFYADAITGTLEVTDTVPTLVPGQVVTLTTPWDYGTLPAGTHQLVAAVDRSAFPGASTRVSVYTTTLTVAPDLSVNPYELLASSLPDGRVAITATVHNIGSVTSPPTDIAIYVDTPFSNTTTVTTGTLPSLTPAGTTTFTATWDNPTPGDHTFYVAVDQARTTMETSYADKLASVVFSPTIGGPVGTPTATSGTGTSTAIPAMTGVATTTGTPSTTVVAGTPLPTTTSTVTSAATPTIDTSTPTATATTGVATPTSSDTPAATSTPTTMTPTSTVAPMGTPTAAVTTTPESTRTPVPTPTPWDVTGQISLIIRGSQIWATHALSVSVKSTGSSALGNVLVVLGRITQRSGIPVTVSNSDLPTSDASAGGFIYTDTQKLPLVPGAQSAARLWLFSNPSNAHFTFTTTIYAVVLPTTTSKAGAGASVRSAKARRVAETFAIEVPGNGQPATITRQASGRSGAKDEPPSSRIVRRVAERSRSPVVRATLSNRSYNGDSLLFLRTQASVGHGPCLLSWPLLPCAYIG